MNTERPSFTCPRCGAVSYHPKDIEHRYCGRCQAFVDDDQVQTAPQQNGTQREGVSPDLNG